MDQSTASLDGREADHAEEAITVVLADDHQVVRDGIKLILDGALDIDVIAEAGDVAAATRLVVDRNPSILLLDLNMPRGSSLAVIPRLAEIAPETRTIVVTMRAEADLAEQAIAAGARGYVLKRAAGGELLEAIRTVLAGGVFVSRALRGATAG
jgi:two-component system response regulator NreC